MTLFVPMMMGWLSWMDVTCSSSSICVPYSRALVTGLVRVRRFWKLAVVADLQSRTWPVATSVMQRLMNQEDPVNPAEPEMILVAERSPRLSLL